MSNQPQPAAVAAKLAPLVEKYLHAKAAAQLTREIIGREQRAALAALGVKDEDGAPITDPARAYLMAEEYAAAYYADCDARAARLGYALPAGHCPALVAEGVERDARRAMIDAAAEFFPGLTTDAILSAPRALENLDKAADLICGLVCSAGKISSRWPRARRRRTA